ncbi:hypothetical protein [Haloarcula brevis]|uniref:hypothetical protein n=1 Tax=Haloarcula brevis TaxID=3111453 RepID=UPI00300E9EA4
MADSDQVKAALAALADGEGDDGTTAVAERNGGGANRATTDGTGDEADYRAVIQQASDATDDLDAAVAFLDTFGVDRLEAAVAQAEHEVSGLADEGRAALRAFQRYRDAATEADGGP